MTARSSTSLRAAACAVFFAAQGAVAADQVATATGTCGVAINASGQARVVVNNYCDATTAATVQRLLDKAAEQERLNKQQAQRTNQLERDRDAQARQIQELSAAVQTVTKLASATKATPADKRAQELLAQGDASGAATLLGREAAAAGASAAELYRQQAALLRLSNTAQALAAIERSLAIEPDNFDAQWAAGDLAVSVGNLDSARQHYGRMLAIANARSTASPLSSLWARSLSVSHIEIGNTQSAQGDLAGALKSYQAGMAIAQKLAASDPSNSEWQRDLSVSHERIGNTQSAQGDLAGALKSYQAGMAIAQKLAASDPSNSEGQRDLSVSHSKIGDTQSAQGDLAGALKSCQAGMAIAQKLAASDPSNSQWQRDLSISHNKIGETQSAQGDLAGALKSYQAGMAIAQKLAASDPSNSEWQTDVAVSAWKIGTLKGFPQNAAERRAVLVQGLKVLDSLAQRQLLAPTRAGWPEMFRKAIAELQ